MVGEPQSTASLNFKSNDLASSLLKVTLKTFLLFLKDLNLNLDINLAINFIDCEVGDSYDNITKM